MRSLDLQGLCSVSSLLSPTLTGASPTCPSPPMPRPAGLRAEAFRGSQSWRTPRLAPGLPLTTPGPLAQADPTAGLCRCPGPPRRAAALSWLSQGVWSAGLGGPSASAPTFAGLAEPRALACDPGKKHGRRPRAQDRAAPRLGLSRLPASARPRPLSPHPGPAPPPAAPSPSTRPPPPHSAFAHPARLCPRGL